MAKTEKAFKILLITLVALNIAAGVYAYILFKGGNKNNYTPPVNNTPATYHPPQNNNSGNQYLPVQPLQAEVNIKVPFASQAPFRIWDLFHNEMCEEAAIVMVYAWSNNLTLTPDSIDAQLYRLAQWETENLGTYYDTSAADTAKMAQAIYGLRYKLIQNPTIEQIKQELNSGNIVVMGMAGQFLENPYFTSPGPLYHMLLLRGYNDKGFFVNDPGTNTIGENFFYSYENIKLSAHDWNGSKQALPTAPASAIIFYK